MTKNVRDYSDEDTEPVLTVAVHETGYEAFIAYIGQQRRLAMAARVDSTTTPVDVQSLPPVTDTEEAQR